MTNLRKLLVVLLIAVLMIGVSNVVLATEEDENITFIPDEGANNQTETNNTTNPLNNTNTNNSVNNATNNTVKNTVKNNTNNANSSKYNNTNLPNAGTSDGITVMVVVTVFGISALYAYKKIRDYNIN